MTLAHFERTLIAFAALARPALPASHTKGLASVLDEVAARNPSVVGRRAAEAAASAHARRRLGAADGGPAS